MDTSGDKLWNKKQLKDVELEAQESSTIIELKDIIIKTKLETITIKDEVKGNKQNHFDNQNTWIRDLSIIHSLNMAVEMINLLLKDSI